MNGGANESRTRDLLHAMQARYQLRYSPICNLLFMRSLDVMLSLSKHDVEVSTLNIMLRQAQHDILIAEPN